MYEQAVLLELKAKMFRGLADTTRLSILESLRNGERTVGSIVEATGHSQPNVSNHLSCLKACGLVSSRRDGKSIYYSIATDKIRCLLEDSDGIVTEKGEMMHHCTGYKNKEGCG